MAILNKYLPFIMLLLGATSLYFDSEILLADHGGTTIRNFGLLYCGLWWISCGFACTKGKVDNLLSENSNCKGMVRLLCMMFFSKSSDATPALVFANASSILNKIVVHSSA